MMVPNKETGRLNKITQRDAYAMGNFFDTSQNERLSI